VVGVGVGGAYLSFEVADEQAVEDLARFVAVAYVFEGFRGVLAADVYHDFFAATIQSRYTVNTCPRLLRPLMLSGQFSPGLVGGNVRVLVHETTAVVDFVVHDEVEVLLRCVLRHFRIRELLRLRHCGLSVEGFFLPGLSFNVCPLWVDV